MKKTYDELLILIRHYCKELCEKQENLSHAEIMKLTTKINNYSALLEEAWRARY